MVTWTKKVLRYTKIIRALIKGLKVVGKCCLNWGFFFIMTSIVVLDAQL